MLSETRSDIGHLLPPALVKWLFGGHHGELGSMEAICGGNTINSTAR